MTRIRVLPQCSNVQDALCIGQSYRTTSMRLSKNAVIAKGMATRSPDLQNGRFQQQGQCKFWEWIWWTSRASTPWSQSITPLAFSPMTSLAVRQLTLSQKCSTTSSRNLHLPRKSSLIMAHASDLTNSVAFVIGLTLDILCQAHTTIAETVEQKGQLVRLNRS